MPSRFQLQVAHEWLTHDPFGKPKSADISSAAYPATDLRAARNGYVSFRVLVRGQGAYRLSASVSGDLEADLYKAWYHRLSSSAEQSETYLPDALIPVHGGQAFHLPDPDNCIEGQTTQEFWVDVFVPVETAPGLVEGQVQLTTNGESVSSPIRLLVIEAVVPAGF